MKTRIISAAILAIGLMALGLFIKGGIDDYANKDRQVSVKGLAEREVAADKVTWPIVSKEQGNNLLELYDRIAVKQQKIKQFLIKSGIQPNEISINPPKVVDVKADQYSSNEREYRYYATLIITVTSHKVDLVRSIIARQGELLKQGIAIVAGDYDTNIDYEYVSFKAMKPRMMQEAIVNAETTAQQFAKNSHSKLDKIVSADQGQFSIEDRDSNTPYIKKVRVVTTVTYSLKD